MVNRQAVHLSSSHNPSHSESFPFPSKTTLKPPLNLSRPPAMLLQLFPRYGFHFPIAAPTQDAWIWGANFQDSLSAYLSPCLSSRRRSLSGSCVVGGACLGASPSGSFRNFWPRCALHRLALPCWQEALALLNWSLLRSFSQTCGVTVPLVRPAICTLCV